MFSFLLFEAPNTRQTPAVLLGCNQEKHHLEKQQEELMTINES